MMFLRLEPKDNVLVALPNLNLGTSINFESSAIVVKDPVPAKHKVFISDI